MLAVLPNILHEEQRSKHHQAPWEHGVATSETESINVEKHSLLVSPGMPRTFFGMCSSPSIYSTKDVFRFRSRSSHFAGPRPVERGNMDAARPLRLPRPQEQREAGLPVAVFFLSTKDETKTLIPQSILSQYASSEQHDVGPRVSMIERRVLKRLISEQLEKQFERDTVAPWLLSIAVPTVDAREPRTPMNVLTDVEAGSVHVVIRPESEEEDIEDHTAAGRRNYTRRFTVTDKASVDALVGQLRSDKKAWKDLVKAWKEQQQQQDERAASSTRQSFLDFQRQMGENPPPRHNIRYRVAVEDVVTFAALVSRDFVTEVGLAGPSERRYWPDAMGELQASLGIYRQLKHVETLLLSATWWGPADVNGFAYRNGKDAACFTRNALLRGLPYLRTVKIVGVQYFQFDILPTLLKEATGLRTLFLVEMEERALLAADGALKSKRGRDKDSDNAEVDPGLFLSEMDDDERDDTEATGTVRMWNALPGPASNPRDRIAARRSEVANSSSPRLLALLRDATAPLHQTSSSSVHDRKPLDIVIEHTDLNALRNRDVPRFLFWETKGAVRAMRLASCGLEDVRFLVRDGDGGPELTEQDGLDLPTTPEILDLEDNRIADDELGALLHFLGTHPRGRAVHTLNISGNPIGLEGLHTLKTFFTNQAASATSMKTSGLVHLIMDFPSASRTTCGASTSFPPDKSAAAREDETAILAELIQAVSNRGSVVAQRILLSTKSQEDHDELRLREGMDASTYHQDGVVDTRYAPTALPAALFRITLVVPSPAESDAKVDEAECADAQQQPIVIEEARRVIANAQSGVTPASGADVKSPLEVAGVVDDHDRGVISPEFLKRKLIPFHRRLGRLVRESDLANMVATKIDIAQGSFHSLALGRGTLEKRVELVKPSKREHDREWFTDVVRNGPWDHVLQLGNWNYGLRNQVPFYADTDTDGEPSGGEEAVGPNRMGPKPVTTRRRAVEARGGSK